MSSTTRKLRFTALVGGLLVIGVVVFGRLAPLTVATRFSVALFHALDRAQLDDELAGASLRIAAALFPKNATAVQASIFQVALTERRLPNDLLIFNMASYLAPRLSPSSAKQLFIEEAVRLRSGSCDRMYLIASIIPLAERGGIAASRVHDVVDSYVSIGRSATPGQSDAERCAVYRAALERLLSTSS